MTRLREEAFTHIYPSVANALFVEKGGDYGCRNQLSVRHDMVVPLLGTTALELIGCHRLTQCLKERIHLLDTVLCRAKKVGDDGVVIRLDFGDFLLARIGVALAHSIENLLQSVGCLAHCRDDNEQLLLATNYVQEVANTLGVTHRCTSKFVYFHKIFLLLGAKLKIKCEKLSV